MWWILALLILLGVIFFTIETLLTPGVGIPGILGLLSLGGACWYAFDTYSPEVGRWVTAGVLVLVILIIILFLRGKTWRRFALNTEIDSKVNVEAEKLSVGMNGKAQTRLAPMGTGRFDSITCEVKSYDNSMVDAGTAIEIVEIVDGKIIVKPITN